MAKKKANGIKTVSGDEKADTNGTTKPHEEKIERKRYKQKLPCPLSPETIVLRADDLAKAVREREAFAEENRARNAEAREKRAHFDEKISELATAVEQHSESREVEVVEYLVRGQIEIWRQDTVELVTTKAATQEDLQESIFQKIDKANEKANEAKGPPKREDTKVLGEMFGPHGQAYDDAIPFGGDDDEDEDETDSAGA